jgi:hypothetical protein
VTLYTTIEKRENEREIPFFNLSVSQVTNVPDVIIFNSLEFLIQHIQFRSDDLLIQDLSLVFEQNILKILETNFTGINEIFVNEKLENTIVNKQSGMTTKEYMN